MEWHEWLVVAGLAVAALAMMGWISRQLQRPLEWMIDSRIDPASDYDAPPDGPWSAPSADGPAREAKLQRGW
ncbi:hypothetical protein [Aquabacterium humicola]|uniref:hypothetical protein n=1 Tax=Aquabacterium humicola TaxID=3237377 RepID=UPI002542F1FD|nr:hypothetical protein [Rubrivivax pictus]